MSAAAGDGPARAAAFTRVIWRFSISRNRLHPLLFSCFLAFRRLKSVFPSLFGQKKRDWKRCVSIRKQRRKKAAFARLRTNAKRSCVQTIRGSFAARTTNQGCLRCFSLHPHQNRPFYGVCSSAPEFWMEKVQRAAPQALVAWGAALRAFYAKILRQN